MSCTPFTVRRRTFMCVTLFIVVLAITLAFVQAQEEAAATEAVQEHHDDDHHHHDTAFVEAVQATVVGTEEAAQQADNPAVVTEDEAQQQQVENEVTVEPAEANASEEAERVRREEEERVRREEEERVRREEEERVRREEEERVRREEEERVRREEEERVRREEEERVRREEEERVRREEEERVRREEEERVRREEEERVRREEEERVRREEEERKRREEAARLRREEEARKRREEEEKKKRVLDSVDVIRSSAKELPGGCASAVETYLFRIHEERQRPAATVSETRAKLNEARVNTPTQVAKLEKKLAQAQDTLLIFDVQTLRTYGGNVPKTCIAEGQEWYDSQANVESDNTYVQAYTHFYRLIAAHVYTMYRTAEGLVYYLIHSYTPAFHSFTATASDYQNKAWAIYEELFSAEGSHSDMPIKVLAKQIATMVGYASVPIGLGIAAGFVFVIAFPPVAAGLLIYEYLYKIWAELFIFYYIYGMKMPDGLVAAFKTTVENVKNSQWDVLGTRSADAFFGLVIDSEKIFYNGFLAVFLLMHVVAIAFILLCAWCRCCVPGMRSRKAKKSPKPAAPAKKASPTQASAEKKKN